MFQSGARDHVGPAPLSEAGRVLAFLDMGTNSIRLLLVRINHNRSYTLLLQQREVIRLGEGAFQEELLQDAAMERAILAARGFVDIARAYGAEELVAVATAATRDAANREEFLDRLAKEAGVDMRVISGREEARLIYLGVVSGLVLESRKAVFIDIGGGSTEVTVGDQFEHYYLDTLKLGAIRLAGIFFRPDETGPISEDRYALIRQYVSSAAVRTVQRVRNLEPEIAVGSSGTIMNLAEITLRRTKKRRLERNDTVRLDELRETIHILRELPLEQRRNVPGINPERADIIVPGAAVLETLLEEMGVTELMVSDRGLREGLLMDYLDRIDLFQGMSVRERSVFQLSRSCGFDETHAREVARLALELFDSGAESGLHRLGRRERELLYYAALLHDVGMFIAFSNHQEHSYYIIRNAELLGFDQKEIGIMAAVALHHRKKSPRKDHPGLTALDKGEKRLVRMLGMFLRLAEALDRSHSEAVERVSFGKVTKKEARLDIFRSKECQLEYWGVLELCEGFERVFGRMLHVNLQEGSSLSAVSGE